MGIPEVTDDPKYPHIIWKRLRGPYDRALTESQLRVVGKMMLQKMVQRDVQICVTFFIASWNPSKHDGWKMFAFPFAMVIFQGLC